VGEVKRDGARDGVGEGRPIVLYGEGIVHGGASEGEKGKLKHGEGKRKRKGVKGEVGMGRGGGGRWGNFWCTREGGGVGVSVMWGFGENLD
jgi:hypothetical protein